MYVFIICVYYIKSKQHHGEVPFVHNYLIVLAVLQQRSLKKAITYSED